MKENSLNLEELAGLYDEFFLIDEALPTAPKEKEKNKKSLTYNGKNIRGILFVYVQSEPLKQEEQAMMKNMLERAAKIPYEYVAHCATYLNQAYSVEEIIQAFSPRIAVIWGGDFLPKHQAISSAECKIIYNHSIADYIANIELKREMWQALEPVLTK